MDSLNRLDRVQPRVVFSVVRRKRSIMRFVARQLDAAPHKPVQPSVSRFADEHFIAWLDAHTKVDPESLVLKEALRNAYAEACGAAGRPVLDERDFSRALLSARPMVTALYRTLPGCGKQQRVFIGLRIKE